MDRTIRPARIRRLQRLAELPGTGDARAASLLIASEGRFLLGVRPPIVERRRVLLRLTGIGGWAEGDESFEETALREGLEETGSPIRLIDLDQTLLVHAPERIETVALVQDIAPAAVVYRRFGTPPFDPWGESYKRITPVAIYAATLVQPAHIMKAEELPLFMWVYPEQMIALADEDEPLEYLLDDGAELVGERILDASRAIVRLTDSIQALVTALGAQAFTFLGDIARLTQPTTVE